MPPTPPRPVVLAYYGLEYFPNTKSKRNGRERGELTVYYNQEIRSRHQGKPQKCQPFEDSVRVNQLIRQLKGDPEQDCLRVWVRARDKKKVWRWVVGKEFGSRFGTGERTSRDEGLGHTDAREAIRVTIMIGTGLTGGTVLAS